jgi:hypothetical protein
VQKNRVRTRRLSPLGDQPMTNEDGTVWVTFNGEIYNLPALREELSSTLSNRWAAGALERHRNGVHGSGAARALMGHALGRPTNG